MTKELVINDMALAAYLQMNYPLERIDTPQGTRKSNFVFIDSDDLQKLINGYWKGTAVVDPQSYFGSLRTLKSRLYATPF